MTERDKLLQAITALEAQRGDLGSDVVDAALAPLRTRLAALDSREDGGAQRRKHVTMMLADMAGFSGMVSGMDAEDVSDTLNDLWRAVDGVVLEHGGMIDKHIGDAVMALWGADRAREDNPEQAIRAALEIHEEVAAFSKERSIPLKMRIGINTGPVVLGDVGITGEFTAMGEAVNITRRLEQAARPGTVLVSHDTFTHVRGVFDVRPQGPISVRGVEHPVRAYVVEQAKPRAFRMSTRGVEGVETRMIGRDSQMQVLKESMHAILCGDSLRLVTVTGDAGVGKSRLLLEFDDWLELQPERIYYFRGRARPDTTTVAFGPIRDMFAYRFHILETDEPARVIEKFRGETADVLDGDEADLVGHMIGFDFSTSPAVQRLLGNPSFGQLGTAYLLRYLRHMSQAPSVMLLEDIHWSDDRSLDLVEILAREMPDAQLLIVCTARPTLYERRPNWGETRGPAPAIAEKEHAVAVRTLLKLTPLSRHHSEELVTEILRRVDLLPPALRDLIVDGAEGNPYYVEELIKMLIEDGVVVRGEDRWRVELDRLTQVRVPPTLTGVLQARLDSLPQAERLVMQQAAVVGRQFWDEAVAVLSDNGSPRDVDAILESLCERELVFRRPQTTLAGTKEYFFKHAMLRDVTYETVLLKKRSEYHGRVARWLRESAGERVAEYCGQIARHFELAGERGQAGQYLSQAGHQLFQESAYRDSIALLERALELLPERDTKARADATTNLGHAYRLVGEFPEAVHAYRDGMSLSHQLGDATSVVAAMSGLGLTARLHGDYEDAERLLAEGLELARAVSDDLGAALCLYNLGDLAYRQGNSANAERYAAASLAIYREHGDHQGIANALRVLGFAHHMRGEYGQAAEHHAESREHYAAIGDLWGIAACLINLGETARLQGHFEEAARYYEDSLQMASDTGVRYEVVVCHNNLGHTKAALGDYEAAREHLRLALEAEIEMGTNPLALETLVGFALVEARCGRPTAAAEVLGFVLDHPAYFDETRKSADPLLEELRATLPDGDLELALERGRALELEALAEGFLQRSPQPVLSGASN
ncbi:MAG: ATP-binding protein [Anaerolineae bacterium]